MASPRFALPVSPRWRKVVRDLSHNKTRTLLVVLSIAIGVFAVGMIMHTAILVIQQVEQDMALARSAHATVYAEDLDDDMLLAIRNIDGVVDADGRSSITLRLRIDRGTGGESGDEEWNALTVRTFPDMEAIEIDRVVPVYTFAADESVGAERGNWPPDEHEISLERSSFLMPGMVPAGLQVGDTITVETQEGKRKALRLAGLTHDLNSIPATFQGNAIGYVNLDTFEWMGGERTYDQVNIVTNVDATDTDAIFAIVTEVERKIERSGRDVYAKVVAEPGKTPRDTILQAIIGLMFPLGAMSLLLSGFLVVNTVNALMSQHVRQIGIMKAIGARNGQIIAMYMVLVAIFGVLALLIAVPLAAFATTQTAGLLAGFLNVTFPPYSLPWEVLLVELVIGLVVPLIAALYPVIKGTRISVHDALSEYGVGQGHFGRSFLDRVLGRIHLFSRPVLLSLRNTFRRRGRLALTLFTLILGGAIFISVTNVRTSLTQTLDDALQYWQYDVTVSFARSYRLEQIEQIARNVPGVAEVESWDFSAVRRQRPDGSESDNIFIGALPADTKMLSPTLISGRWLLPEDENAIVLGQDVLKTESDLAVGDTFIFKIDSRETEWQVVGIARIVAGGNIAYVNYPYYTRIAHTVDRASQIQLVTNRHDAASTEAVSKALEEAYDAAGMQVTSTQTISRLREQNEFYFQIIVMLLLVMAVLIAAVGALGLAGTMSINVLERTREIGVMRAIGASNRAVRNIVMIEGVLIGLLSWIVGALLAIPLARLMSDGVGQAFFQMPLSHVFAYDSIFLWLGIVVVLSVLASILPARNASKLTVRETLAYE